MSNEELYIKFQELVEEIKKQTFDGTEEEIKIQQILYFDKYVKENIEYGFDAINFNIKYPNKKNPYESAFEIEGFFKENEFNGKRQAVCGSISKVANIVLSKLGTKCEYVWGHFNIGSNEKPQYVGHRWNVITIGNKKNMVDFTIGMIIHNFNLSNDYANTSKHLLGIIDNCKEYDYLFFDELAKKETIGGFKKNKNGTTIDDLDQFGYLQNSTTNPYNLFSNLGTIPKECIYKYVEKISEGKTL